jgi:tetratricopeptide (TPR) repeat protein
VTENGLAPFLYGSSPYYQSLPGTQYGNTQRYAIQSRAAFPDPGWSKAVVQSVVYHFSRRLSRPVQVGPLLDEARTAFKKGDYPKALELSDQATALVPNDPGISNLRALVLFALGRYDDAAAPLQAVSVATPISKWETLIGLYGNVAAYTAQLRALENYCNKNPSSAPARLVLAYLYQTQGNHDVAVDQWKQVLVLDPDHLVAKRLVGAPN